jgi:lipid A 3-O-deacylase
MRGHPGTLLWPWQKTPHGRPVRRLHATEAVLAVRCVGFFRLLVGLCTLATGLAGPAHAADSVWIDEVKLGVLAHDIRFLGNHVEPGADINVEVLFPSPAFLRVLWAPRPHLGLSINTAGATDYGYVGLTWSGRPWRPLLALPEGLFITGSLGGSVHDGHLNAAPPDRKILGSRLLFRESVEAGYQLTRRLSLSVMLDHLSNLGLAPHNQGLTNFGARVGVTF